MKKSLLNLTTVAFLATASSAVLATDVTIPNSFTAGDPAVAAEVNDNFTAVKTAVDDNNTNIGTNTTNIGANTTAIGTNTTNIGANTTAIGTNTTNIGANTTDIATNAGDIATNATDIAALQQNGNPTGVACAGNDANDKMVRVGPLCVDKYEASVWNTASGGVTQYGNGSDDYPGPCADNANGCTGADTIYARSEAGVNPSTYITWYQAQQACAASGKRLLTNAEWQMAAAGTPDTADDASTTCVISTVGIQATGSRSACTSNWAVNDMAGNVWEWVADWIQGNGTGGAWSPASGNAGADYGLDVVSGTNAANTQGTNSTNQIAAITRGGRHTAGNGGIFAITADSAPSFSDVDIGFRCAR